MNRLNIMGALSVLLLIGLNLPAHAAHRHHHRAAAASSGGCLPTNDGHLKCDPGAPARPQDRVQVRAPAIDGNGTPVAAADEGTVIGSRPNGCPHAYCGCGLRIYLGLADKRLNLASNWARLLPRVAGPAPGVAAVRSGHVMYIEAAAGNGQWLIRDYNSGGGLSRLHVRDVRGYVFVSPRG
jgi:hypothetical protein